MSEQDSSLEIENWLPDWIPSYIIQRLPPEGSEGKGGGSSRVIQPNSVHEAQQEGIAEEERREKTEMHDGPALEYQEWKSQSPRFVIVQPPENRVTDRQLRGIHLFMITINGVLGVGLYWRGGQILELGGPLAVFLSFSLVGLLAWAVMQCVTEMLCIWPIPGALSVYVSEFVDMELGIAAGVSYWLSYSISFSGLVATSAAELVFWHAIDGNKSLQGLVIYFAIPICLILLNAFRIKIYRYLELYSGVLKILFLMTIFVSMIVLKFVEAVPEESTTQQNQSTEDWSTLHVFDQSAAPNWATAFIMSISIATYAYVGIEIVAASALEAKWSKADKSTSSDLSHRSNDTLIGNTVKFSAIWIPVISAIAYTLTSAMATLDIQYNDCQLPRLSWVKNTSLANSDCSMPPSTSTTNTSSSSVFVIVAQRSNIPHLADIFNAFLVFTCLTCASTNLYVASRTLFGLTSRLDDGPRQPWYLRFFAYFGKTDKNKVPMRAMLFSAFAFWWVPFLQLSSGTKTDNPIGMFVEILSEMASVGALFVWTCECLAFIRYYHCIYNHREALEREKISQVRRWSEKYPDDYPYRGSGQPFLAYAALTGCIFVIIVANGASLWGGFYTMPFLSSYVIILANIAFWIAIKIHRGGKWTFVDLSNEKTVIKKIKTLHDIRLGAS